MLFCMLGYEELVSIWVSTLFLISPTQIKQLFSNQLTNYITLTNAVITVPHKCFQSLYQGSSFINLYDWICAYSKMKM